MARKNQKLINYHTGKKTAMPSGSSVDYGEIVVRHNAESPELLIKIGEDSFGVFQASGAVKTAIDSAVSTAKSELNGDISKLQTSLTGHISDFNTFKGDVKNTYATKDELKSTSGSIITAYTQAVADAKVEIYNSATTFANSAVTVAKGELNGRINTVESNLETLSGVVESISTNIGENYVTTDTLNTTVETLEGKISTAKDDAISSGKTYTDAQITAAKKYTDDQIKVSEGTTNGLINGVDSKVEALEKTVAANKKDVVDNYVLTTTLNTKVSELTSNIATAKSDAIASGKTYTDAQIAAAKEYSDGKLSAATESLKQTITGVDNKVSTLSGNVHTTITNVQTALTKTINDKVSNVYRYKGSCAYAALPTTGNVTGDVWNVTDANGDFPAGTNYAWDGSKWDALGGSIDLSPYAKTEDVNKKIETINQTNTNLQSAIDSVSSATKTLINEVSAATKANYATKTALQTAQNNITTAYTKAITDAKAEVYTSATTFANNAVTAATATLNQSIQDVDGRVTDLSGVTKTVKATADSAVQSATVNSNAKVTKNGTSLDFDFSGLIIDCGDF